MSGDVYEDDYPEKKDDTFEYQAYTMSRHSEHAWNCEVCRSISRELQQLKENNASR